MISKKKMRPPFRHTILAILIALAGACCADGPSYKLRAEYPEGDQTAFSYGVASAVDPTTLVTAKHLIHKHKDEEIFIRTPDGWIQCDFVKDAPDGSDLCELKCRVELKRFASLDTVNPVKDEPVEIQGGNKRDLQNFKAVVLDEKTIRCPEYNHGSSGAPLVSGKKVIGVTTGMNSTDGVHPDGTVHVIPCVEIAKELFPGFYDTFAGEIIPPPKDVKAEIVPLPSIPTWPELPQPQTCKHCQKVPVKTPINISSKRHWEEDAYGQGHYVWDSP